MGFSAGGHLAATTSTMWTEQQTRPDFSVLIYPVITMEVGLTHKGTRENLITEKAIWKEHISEKYSLENQVTRFTPPTFLAHCSDDFTVPVENSLRYYNRLIDNDVKAEMHIWPRGAHGWGFNEDKYIGKGKDKFSYAREYYYEALERWLKEIR
jgi:acetyl esterase/lipase